MTPQQYLDEIVVPTFKEYEEETSSRRKGYLACIVVYHLSDYLKNAGANDPAKTMRTHCLAAWNVVHAVALGAKHHNNFGSQNKNPLKFAAGNDSFRPQAVSGELECGWSELGDEYGSIVIPVGEDDIQANVLDALRTVIHQYHLQYGGSLISFSISSAL